MRTSAPFAPVPILLYHGVADDVDGPLAPWVVTPAEFRRHMELIGDEGLHTTTVGALVDRIHRRGLPPDPRTVVITFDDGFADFAEGAWPVLDDLGLAATLYVTSGGIGDKAFWLPGDAGERPMLDWPTLMALDDGGVEIGAHTHTHPQLDLLRDADAQAEIRRGREVLEDGLGRGVTTFAYPHGYHSRSLRQSVAAEGFSSACGVGHAFSSAADDPFSLARVMVRHGDDPEQVRQWLRGHGLPVRPRGRRRVLASAWRQARRVRTSTTRVRSTTIPEQATC